MLVIIAINAVPPEDTQCNLLQSSVLHYSCRTDDNFTKLHIQLPSGKFKIPFVDLNCFVAILNGDGDIRRNEKSMNKSCEAKLYMQ